MSAQLVSPLLDNGHASDSYAAGSPVASHAIDTTSSVTDGKFGEYVSRAKARAANTMTVLCGCPFNLCMLLCIMFLTFGSYWCYDIPGSIETQLTLWFNNGKKDGSYTDASNSLLYSIYSWPNCILAFFGGFIIDKITGVRRGALLFCGLVGLGQFIFSMGVQYKIYYLAFFGRFIFGLGGESLTVAQNFYVVRWFDGKRLALAFGLVVAFSRIGTSVNFVVSPKLADSHNGVPLTVWIGMGMCLLSFCACLVASGLDFWGESKVEAQRQVYMSTLSAEEAIYVKKLDVLAEPVSDDISFKMIARIPLTAWLLFIITAFFYVAILNFYQVASDLMQNTGKFVSADTAGLYLAIPNFVAIVASPLGGAMVDKVGRALMFVALACIMLICAHVFFLALAYGWVSYSPVPIMIWLGITYSLGASCLWPILAFVVDKDALGTAYGCMTSVQNLFLAVFAVIIGQLQDWAKPRVLEYTLPIMIFIGCAVIAFLLTIVLIALDAARGGKLNASSDERSARLAAEEAAAEESNQAAFGRGGASDQAAAEKQQQQQQDMTVNGTY